MNERCQGLSACVYSLGMMRSPKLGRGTLGRASRRNGMRGLSDQRTRRRRRVKKGNVEEGPAGLRFKILRVLGHAERTISESNATSSLTSAWPILIFTASALKIQCRLQHGGVWDGKELVLCIVNVTFCEFLFKRKSDTLIR